MKLNTLTFFAMIAVPVLLLQSGCQEQNKATKEPAAAPIRPVPAVQQEKIKTTPESNQTAIRPAQILHSRHRQEG